MVQFTETATFPACCPSGSGTLESISRFRIPSHSLAGFYLQKPFASFAPALTVVSWLSVVLLARTTLSRLSAPDRCVSRMGTAEVLD